MINLFNRHPKESGFGGYFSHMKFAICISVRLAASAFVFLVHSAFPFVPVPRILNLETTALFLIDKNNELD
jgi:hypothetical protein